MRLQSTHHVLTALVGFFCLTVTLSAETIFLEYNKNCTDRYEYTLTKNQVEQPYISYHYKVKNRRVVLNVGNEADNVVPRMPAGTMTCNTSTINESMARAINDGDTEIFMVRKLPIGFNVTKVKSANVLTTEGKSLVFFNDGTDFTVGSTGQVAGAGTTSVVGASTDGKRHCFSTVELSTATPTPEGVVSMTMIPQLGVIEERGTSDDAYLRRLVKINNVPFGQYLKSVCKGENPATYSQQDIRIVRGSGAAPVAPKARVAIPSEATPTSQPETLTAKGSAKVNPCDLPQQLGFHKVGRGETLYAISRRYNLSVDQLKEWNGMSDNTITPCDQLKISAPVSRTAAIADIPVRAKATTPAPTAPTTMSTESTVMTERSAPVVSKPAPAPAPVVAAPAPKAAPAATLPAWTTTAEYYTARAGDKVKEVAERYGYTEARFRWMNGMSATDVLKSGQLIRIRDCNSGGGSSMIPKSYEDKSDRYNDVFQNKGTTTTSAPAPQSYSAPAAAMSTPATGAVSTSGQPRRVHVVAQGESLYGIAKTYNLSTDALRALNSMDKGEIIVPDQVLYIE